MKKTVLICIAVIVFSSLKSQNNDKILIEAESFAQKGGWVIDQQSMDVMGSPYLMAHGMGVPVPDASTSVNFPVPGKYHVFVRTRNWVARWNTTDAPGKFQLSVDGKMLEPIFGTKSEDWDWQDGGIVEVKNKNCKLLHFNRRAGQLGSCL